MFSLRRRKHREVACKTGYEEKLNQRWERVRRELVGVAEEEWRRFKETILDVGESSVSVRLKGSGGRRGALNKMKCRKPFEGVWYCSRIEWILAIFNRYMEMVLYQRNKKYRVSFKYAKGQGIGVNGKLQSILTIPGKVYGRVITS